LTEALPRWDVTKTWTVEYLAGVALSIAAVQAPAGVAGGETEGADDGSNAWGTPP